MNFVTAGSGQVKQGGEEKKAQHSGLWRQECKPEIGESGNEALVPVGPPKRPFMGGWDGVSQSVCRHLRKTGRREWPCHRLSQVPYAGKPAFFVLVGWLCSMHWFC